MTDLLATLAAPASHAVEIKKSRFLAQARSVATPEAALAWIDSLRGNGGGHHCWAYRIGSAYRYNDDGEPSSSAGKPILAAIDGQDLDRAVVVVTRWFGGIKLGIGGLIRAYGGSAAQCLRQAQRHPIVPTAPMTLTCDFSQWALLEVRLHERGIVVAAVDYGAHAVCTTLCVPITQIPDVTRLISDVTQGQSKLLPE